MNLLLLHGTTGVWDEVVCLVVPATAIMAVALAVLRQGPAGADGPESAEVEGADEGRLADTMALHKDGE